MQQMVPMASINKIFEKNATLPGSYNCKIDTSKADVEWLGWQESKEFEAKYLDDSMHKVNCKRERARAVADASQFAPPLTRLFLDPH